MFSILVILVFSWFLRQQKKAKKKKTPGDWAGNKRGVFDKN